MILGVPLFQETSDTKWICQIWKQSMLRLLQWGEPDTQFSTLVTNIQRTKGLAELEVGNKQ